MCELTTDRSVTLWGDTRSPSAAREFVSEHVCVEHGVAAVGAMLSLTSELVTNAVLHGEPPVTVRLSCSETELLLAVRDTGQDVPGSTQALGGVGLAIVEKIARDWGVTPMARGKEVWCRVATGILPPREAPGLVASPTLAAWPPGHRQVRSRT